MSFDCTPKPRGEEHDIIVHQDFLEESVKSLEKMAETALVARLLQPVRPLEDVARQCVELLQALNHRGR